MGKFDGVLLVSDICDTLIDTSIHGPLTEGRLEPVSEQNRQALEYFTGEGGRFTVATGRPLSVVQPYADTIPINAPGVLGNGVAICDLKSGEYLETALLDERARDLGQAVLNRFPTVTAQICLLDSEVYFVRLDSDARLRMECNKHNLEFPMLEVSSLLEVPLPIRIIFFKDQYKMLGEIRNFIREQSRDGTYQLVLSLEQQDEADRDRLRMTDKGRLQMTAKGVSKARMVRHLAERLDISMEHVYCVGDGDNDVSMLTAAKQGFAPDNCTQAVRKCGATVVRSANRDTLDAVVKILDQQY